MSLVCCGTCGEPIGLTGRCEHQPAPVAAGLAPAPKEDDLDQFLAECVGDDASDLEVEPLTDEDFNVGIPRWRLADIVADEQPFASP